jgi:hypothetical protein
MSYVAAAGLQDILSFSNAYRAATVLSNVQLRGLIFISLLRGILSILQSKH